MRRPGQPDVALKVITDPQYQWISENVRAPFFSAAARASHI